MAKTPKRRQYSEEEKAKALELYASDGLAATAKQLDIPKQRISSWARAAGVRTSASKKGAEQTAAATEEIKRLVAERRELLLPRLIDHAMHLLDLISAEHEDIRVLREDGKDAGQKVERVKLERPTAGSIRDYTVALGITLEKIQLLEGGATERIEHHGVPTPERLNQIRDDLAARRKA